MERDKDATSDRQLTLSEQLDTLRTRALADVTEAAVRREKAEKEFARAKQAVADAVKVAAQVVTDHAALAEAAGVSVSTIAKWAPKTSRRRKVGAENPSRTGHAEDGALVAAPPSKP